jgi:hypothetical protein
VSCLKFIADCSIADQIDKNEMGGASDGVVERKSAYRVSMGQPDGTRPLQKLRIEDNINMDLKEVEWGHELD